MTATSRVGSRRRARGRRCSGFSLIELVVAVTVAALTVGLAAPRLGKAYEGVQFDAATRAILIAARKARTAAVLGHREVVFAFDPLRKRFRSGAEAWQAIEPRDTSLKLTVAELERTDDIAGIRFYPDGSATGGRIELGLGQRDAVIDVDWLTGVARKLE